MTPQATSDPAGTTGPPAADDHAGARSGAPADPPPDDATALAALGMLAYLELAAFSRLAADAAAAPSLEQRLELTRLAGTTHARFERVAERIGELGGSLQPVMEPFAGMLAEFDSRTEPSTWTERLLKTYVGYGVADDFCRILAGPLEPGTRALVMDVLSDAGHAALVVESLERAASSDPTLAARLALWGRRLVGEALTVVQQVLAGHPRLRDLLVRSGAVPTGEAQQALFSLLTAEHSRRMERLGLTP